MTTVGYGDRHPVMGQGRLVAVARMVSGIAILGIITDTLASWLIEHVAAAEQQQTRDLQEQLDEVRGQLNDVLSRLPGDSGTYANLDDAWAARVFRLAPPSPGIFPGGSYGNRAGVKQAGRARVAALP